jgi:hypothetical protein
MKYAILLSFVGALALIMGCEDEPTNSGSSSSSSSSSSSGQGGEGGTSSSSSSSGQGGEASSSSSSSGGGSGGSGGAGGGGGAPVCDNATVVDKADPAMRCTGAGNDMVQDTVMAPASMVWADKIEPNGFSSQYSPTDYSAMQATGAPNVYPSAADEPAAWASQTTDDQDEFIIVGFTTPVVAESVWVFETYNPGAISKITVKAADGDHVVYDKPAPTSVGACAHVLSVSTKTCSPISAVRIDVASPDVPGYNEIDAVGLVPAPK